MPMICRAPRARHSIAVARPTGPRPVTSTASLPLTPTRSMPFVHRPEPAGHLRAVGVRQRVGQQDEVLLLREHVVGHAAVTLPAVRAPVLAGARDHVAAPAVVAHAAPGDVVDDDAVAHLEAPAARAGGHDLPARLVARDHARLVALGPLAEVLVVDAADVRAADRGALGPDQHFAVSRFRDGELTQLRAAVARKHETPHRLVHVPSPHSESCQASVRQVARVRQGECKPQAPRHSSGCAA